MLSQNLIILHIKQSYRLCYKTLFFVLLSHMNGKMFNESSTQIKVDRKKKKLNSTKLTFIQLIRIEFLL